MIEIPPEFEPHISQIPGYAVDVDRFRICFAVTLQQWQGVFPLVTKELYDSDIETGDDLPPSPYPAVRKLAVVRAHKHGAISDFEASEWLDAHLGQQVLLKLVFDQGEYDVTPLAMLGVLNKTDPDNQQVLDFGHLSRYFVGGPPGLSMSFDNIGFEAMFYVWSGPPNTGGTMTLKLSPDAEIRITALVE